MSNNCSTVATSLSCRLLFLLYIVSHVHIQSYCHVFYPHYTTVLLLLISFCTLTFPAQLPGKNFLLSLKTTDICTCLRSIDYADTSMQCVISCSRYMFITRPEIAVKLEASTLTKTAVSVTVTVEY